MVSFARSTYGRVAAALDRDAPASGLSDSREDVKTSFDQYVVAGGASLVRLAALLTGINLAPKPGTRVINVYLSHDSELLDSSNEPRRNIFARPWPGANPGRPR